MTAFASGPVPQRPKPERDKPTLDPARSGQHITHTHPGQFSMKIPGQVSAQINIQFLYRERAARHARPAHLDPMIGGQIRHWPVAAHVEQRLRRQEPLDQRTGRRLGVVGIGFALDHIGHGRTNAASARIASSLQDHHRRKAADRSDIQIGMSRSNGWSYRSDCAI